MLSNLKPERYQASDTHSPSSNTAAIVTLVGATGSSHVLCSIDYSYAGTGTLTGGLLTVTDNSVVVWQVGVFAKGQAHKTFSPPMEAAYASNLVVTLAAGGSDVLGVVSLGHRSESRTGTVPVSMNFQLGGNAPYVAIL